MRHTSRFSTIARVVGALTAAALLALAAAPDAQAQDPPTNFGQVVTGPSDATVGGLFQVTFQFKVNSDDTNGVIVTGFTTSDVSVSDSKGVVQSISRAATTNIYRVNIRANSSVGATDNETVTATLAANAVTYASGGTTYSNTGSQQVSVTVDQSKPTVTLTAQTLTGGTESDNLVNGKFRVQFDFSETVTGFTLSDITVANGTKSNFRTETAGDIYTVDVMPTSGFDGDLKVTVPGGSVTDSVGNMIQKTELKVKVDQTRPTVTIAAPSQWGDESFKATVTFSEVVTGFTSEDVTVKEYTTTTGGTGVALTGSAVSGAGRVYTVTIDPTNTTKRLTIAIAENLARDTARVGDGDGNGNRGATYASPFTGTVMIDAARPTITSTTITKDSNGNVDLSATETTTFTVGITFSENVTGFQQGGGDISVTNGTVTLAGELPGSSFTATVTPTANHEGDMTITIPAGAAKSAANSAKGNPRYTEMVTISQGAPTPTIAVSKSKTKDSVTATVTFPEPVTGFEKSSSEDGSSGDIAITDIVSGALTISDYTVSGKTTYKGTVYATTYAVTVTLPIGEDDVSDGNTIVFNVASGAAKDRVGNDNAEASTAEAARTVTVDQTAPTLTITAPGSAKGAFEATFTFNEHIKEGSFTAADITVANGTAGTVTGSNSTGEGEQSSTWKSTITPTTGFNGTLTINVAANVTTDIAGNGNKVYDRVPDDTEEPIDQTTLGVQPWSVTIDQNAPTVVLTPESTKENGPFTVTMVFSESVTGLTAADIEVPIIDNGRADNTETTNVDESKTAQATVSEVAGGGTNWTAKITPRAAADNDIDATPNVDESMAFNGNLTIKVKADAAIDTSGNGNTASNTATVNINTVKPTLTIATKDTRGAGKDFNGPFTATFTFSKSVTGFSKDDITVTGGGDNRTISTVAGSGTTYTATITPTPDDDSTSDTDESFQGDMTITVAVDRVEDAHGNGNVVYDSNATEDGDQTYSVKIDTTKPVPVLTLVNPNNLTSFGHAEDLTFQVRFTNGSDGSNEDVTGLATGDFTFKYMPVSKVVNDNATTDNLTDDVTTYEDGIKTDGTVDTEKDGGGTAKSGSVKTVPVEDAADTYTVVIDPDLFNAGTTSATIDDRNNTPTGSKETITPAVRRKLRIYFPVNKVTDKAGNSNAILPDQDDGTTGDQNYVTVTLDPGIPTIAITTSLTRTAFSGNQLSNGQPFTVTFTSSHDLGVFGSEDVSLSVGESDATKTNFSGSGNRYTMTVTPRLRVVGGDNPNDGYTGDLTISIAANINSLGNYAASRKIYVDQDTPQITAFTGIYKENEDGTVASEVTSPARLDGSAFYVKLTTDEEVENLSNANFVIYEVGDTKSTKTSVGRATAFKGSDPTNDGAEQTWDVKIQPNSGFSGNMAIMVKKGAGTDRAGTAVAISSDLTATTLGGTTADPTIVIDQVGPVPLITFSNTTHGNRHVNNDTTQPQIPHNVISSSASTFTVTIRHKDGSRTTGTGSAKMPIFENVNAQYDSEDNFTTADIVLSPKGAGVVTSVDKQGSSATDNWYWQATITPTADTDLTKEGAQPYEGPITLSIPANRFKDVVGHDNAASNTFTAVIDKTAPKATAIGKSTANEVIAPDHPFSLTVTFDGNVTGFGTNPDNQFGTTDDKTLDPDDVSIALYSGALDYTGQSLLDNTSIDANAMLKKNLKFEQISGSTYKVTIELNGDNITAANQTNIAVFVSANAAQDLAVNGNPVSWTSSTEDTDVIFTSSIDYDKTTVEIIARGPVTADKIVGGPTDTSDDADSMALGSQHTDGSYWFKFTFSKLIENFTESDFVVTNGSIVSGSLEKSDADDKLYFARFNATRVGDLVVSLPAGAVTDGALNPSLPSSYSHDVGRPTAAIKIFASGNSTYKDADKLTGPQSGPFKAVVQFNEAISAADKTANSGVLALSFRGASQSGGAWSSTDAGDRYIATITPDASVGGKKEYDLVIGLATNTVEDTSQNGNAPVQKTVKIDKVAPTVVITPTEIGNNVANGNRFTVTFTYDEPVTGFATTDISSLTGGTLVANTLTRAMKDGTVVTDAEKPAEVYTVKIDPSSGVTAVSFTLAANVVNDVAGNASAAYDSDPDTTGNQAHSITVDTVRPTPVISGPAGNKYGNGLFLVTIKFSDAPTADPLVGEDVTGFTLSDLSVTGGVASNLVAVTKKWHYTVNIAPISPTTGSKVKVNIAAEAAIDGAGNKSEAATEYEADFDSTLPYVSSIVAPVASRGEFTATFNFNVPVSGFAEADVTVTDGSVKPSSLSTISSSSYSVVIVPDPAVADDPDTNDVDETKAAFEGDLGISVVAEAAAAVSDATKKTVASASKYVRIDRTAPTVTAFTLNGGQPLGISDYSFVVSITFDENIVASTWAASDLTVTGGTVTNTTAGNRTVTATINSPQQNATVSLGANKVTDLVGNGNVAHVGGSITRGTGTDTDKPSVSITVVDGNYGPRNTSPFQVQITFSAPVTGFVSSELTVTGGTTSSFYAVSGQIYRATIAPTAGQSSVVISVAAGVATKSGSITNTKSNTVTVPISTSSRTVSVTSSATAPVSAAFDVNISFSQNTSGFTAGDITVMNGTVTSLTHVSLSRNWTAKITPTGPEVSVYLVQNVVNGGNAPSNIFTIRSNVGSTVPATLQVSLTGPAAVKAGASTLNIQFTRDGAGVPLMPNTFVIGDLSVTPASITLTNLTPHPSDAGRYMVTVTPPTDFEGNVTVTLAKDAATDMRGNKSPAASFTTKVDSTPPTVAIAGPAGPSNGAVELTITFSESVTEFDADDLTVSGGTAGEITGSGASYKTTVTPAADYNGQLTADIAADAAMDIAGNMSTAAEQYAVTIDQTPPTAMTSGPEGPIREDAVQITITFSEDVGDSFALTDITVANGTASDLMEDADTKGLYTAMIQADEGFEGTLTVDVAAGAATDLAGNENTAAEQYSVEVVLDTTYTLSLTQGLNLIHVPVKMDGLAKVSDLYTALGGSSDVAYILSYVAPVAPAVEGSFAAYIGIPGSSGDTALSDQTAVIVSMRTAKDVSFTGGLLEDTVSLTAGINLIGVPRADAVMKASEVAPGAAAVLVLTTDALGNALFSLVIPNTPTDVAAVGGQGYIVVAAADDSITYTGEAWKDPETEDASPSTAVSSEAVKYDPTSTVALLIEGSFAREDTLEPINGLSVSIKNLRTGKSVVDTAGLTAGSGRFVKPMIDLRGGSYKEGDAFEVSVVDPSGTFGGLTPVRAVVSKDEIAGGRINIGRHLLSAVPDTTTLLPNYPNPFNPETWIPFDLAKSSQVTVTVYNAAGQTVRVLELGQLPAGQYRSRSKAAYWDGRNALGERVSSGLYFYRIEAGSFSALRRMVILK